MPKRSMGPQRGFYPQPAYIIGALGEDGRPNFSLITWIAFCGAQPPMLMFASRPEKMTPGFVLASRAFSANLVTSGMVLLADYFGNVSGHQTDKCADTGVRWSRGPTLPVPVIDDSPLAYECVLVGTVRQGDATVFFGEVRNVLVDERLPDPRYGRIDLRLLDPAIYAPLAYYRVGDRVATVGDSLSCYKPGRSPGAGS